MMNMDQQTIDDLCACIAFITVLNVIWRTKLWPIWRDRRQPVRPDAPTGNEPWTRPRYWR